MKRARLLALLALAGCASTAEVKSSPAARALAHQDHFAAEQLFHASPRESGTESIFKIDWRRDLVEPEFLEWTPHEFMRPAVDDSGRVYVATRDGFVRSFDQDGELIWEHALKGPFFGGISIDADRVYVPSADGVLVALSTQDGSERWRYTAGEELGTRPVIANGLVYVASFSNSIYALDAETGAWKWQYRRESTAEFTIREASTPAVDFDKVFIGFSDGMVMCLDANDGTVKWQRQLSTARQFPDAAADPQLDGNGTSSSPRTPAA